MSRFPDWPVRLAKSLEAAATRPFSYGGQNGTQDCLLFASDIVQAITGVDYGAPFRGYTTKREALQIVARYGSLEAMVTDILGAPPVAPALARRGDVVLGQPPLVEGEEGESVGICVGAQFAFPIAVGFILLPLSLVRLAWRIS